MDSPKQEVTKEAKNGIKGLLAIMLSIGFWIIISSTFFFKELTAFISSLNWIEQLNLVFVVFILFYGGYMKECVK